MQTIVRRMSAAFVGSLIVLVPIAWAAKPTATEPAAATVAGKIAVFRLTGPIREAPPQFDWGMEEQQPSLYELLSRFSKAKKDAKIKAVALIFQQPQLGWAQRHEIREAIHDLKAADKDVYAFLEEEDEATYSIAAAASKIYITPTGSLNLIGLHVEQSYLKGLLDKIGVQADIEHIGAYKGAGEPFTRTGPSDESKEMLNWLVTDLFDQMIQEIAEDRQLQPDQVRGLIDRGPFSAKEAKEARLVDEIAYPEDLVKTLKQRYGDDLDLVHNYGHKELPEVDLSSPFGMFKFFGEMMAKTRTRTKPQIAVVYVDGMIVAGKTEDSLFGDSGLVGSTSLRRLLAKVRDDDQVKAVVLRVNSPGGSAIASDIIWHATRALGDEKPLIISMGDVAASGGYYVSAGGATIFADPGTITGSIGVVGGKMVTAGLWSWVGITFHESSYGKHADLYNTNRPFDEGQRELIRKNMREIYDVFKQRVAEGRKGKIKGELESLAGGRVFTGRQAQSKGLVDQLGGLQDAIKYAATESKVSNYDVVQMPEPKNFLEMFVKGLAGESDEDSGDSIQIRANHYGWLFKTPAVAEALQAVRSLDPAKTRQVMQLLFRLELLSRESTLCVTPSDPLIR